MSPRSNTFPSAKLKLQATALRSARPLPAPPLLAHSPYPRLYQASLSHEFQFFPTTGGSKRFFCFLWNRKLEFEPSKKEPDCTLLVPHAISTSSRLQYRIHWLQQAGPCFLSHPWKWVISLATRIMSSVLLKCLVSPGDPRRELPRSILIVIQRTSEGGSNCSSTSSICQMAVIKRIQAISCTLLTPNLIDVRYIPRLRICLIHSLSNYSLSIH